MPKGQHILRQFKPPRMWIDGKSYNIKPYKREKGKKQQHTLIKDIKDTLKQNEGLYNISSDDDGKLTTKIRLPAIYYIKINSHAYFQLRNLENETKTTISMPKQGKDGYLTITGEEHEKVTEALTQIHSVANDIRDSYTVMQFISIPVLSDEIKENFEKFKSEILSGEPVEGVHESIFQSAKKLHLTIVVFSLMDFEKEAAVEALNAFKSEILDPLLAEKGSLKIKVSGIECMNEDYKKTDVLYAKAQLEEECEDFNLQKISNSLADYLYEKGFVKKYEGQVKLHVTLMNTKYRKEDDDESGWRQKNKRWTKRKSFDATTIMEKYKEFNFGVCNFDTIHLSLISSKGEDGFYKPLATIKLN